MRVINNKVIVIPVLDTNKTRAGLVLDGYDSIEHAPRIVEVVAVPEKLTYHHKKEIFMGMELVNRPTAYYEPDWETDIEIQRGDIAWVNPMAVCMDNDDTKRSAFVLDGQQYFTVNYRDIIVVKRGTRTLCVNGYMLCEFMEEVIEYKLSIPDSERKRFENMMKQNDGAYNSDTAAIMAACHNKSDSWKVKVVHAGKPNRRYKNDRRTDMAYTYKDRLIGEGTTMRIQFKYAGGEPSILWLEHPTHKQFDGKKQYIVLQRADRKIKEIYST